MGLFGISFGANAARLTALIDISSGSVHGGYTVSQKNGERAIVYSTRIPILVQGTEPLRDAMLRAVAELEKRLAGEGAAALRRAAGSGRAERAVVSVGSPWQETRVRIERLEEPKPFTFTRALMNETVARTAARPSGRTPSDETVIATILNGYETREPFGKRIKLADIVVLSSSMDEAAERGIRDALRPLFRDRELMLTSSSALSYTVLRDAFPHEKDFLVLRVSGEHTDIAFVERGLLVSVLSAACGTNALTRGKHVPISADLEPPKNGVRVARSAADANAGRGTWVECVIGVLKTFSEEHPLPRTLFLIADDTAREYLKSALDDPKLRSLWLSDEPLSVMPIGPTSLAPLVKVGAGAEADAALMMLALFHEKTGSGA